MALALRQGQGSVGFQQRSGRGHRRLTWDDLQRLPDDEGLRYELLDGVLLVSPAPNLDHQDMVLSLGALLREVVPPELKVFVAPVDWFVGFDTVLQPDVVVVRRADVRGVRRLEATPVLVVEVLSPSSRLLDLGGKKRRYAKEGVVHYWVLEPGEPPGLTAFRLRNGHYVEDAVATGTEAFETVEPFPVTVTPADLLD